MKNKTLFKLAVITAAIGLFIIFSVILSGAAYPDMLFKIGTPLGLLFVFLSVILGSISWLWYIKNAIKSKQYFGGIIVAALGLIVIVKEVIKIL